MAVRTTAHLRSRGEDERDQHLALIKDGSPPLARRGLAEFGRRIEDDRLTSARAERTCRPGTTAPRGSAHLRSRGEDPTPAAARPSMNGSPPLARRGPTDLVSWLHRQRLTSARAERTTGWAVAPPADSAHLRSRGEDRALADQPGLVRGSPPLARRGPDRGRQVLRGLRLTSARAERTTRTPSTGHRPAAHLRSRGEDVGGRDPPNVLGGSPPLARRGRGGDDA